MEYVFFKQFIDQKLSQYDHILYPKTLEDYEKYRKQLIKQRRESKPEHINSMIQAEAFLNMVVNYDNQSIASEYDRQTNQLLDAMKQNLKKAVFSHTNRLVWQRKGKRLKSKILKVIRGFMRERKSNLLANTFCNSSIRLYGRGGPTMSDDTLPSHQTLTEPLYDKHDLV